jgi:hypothetical protein
LVRETALSAWVPAIQAGHLLNATSWLPGLFTFCLRHHVAERDVRRLVRQLRIAPNEFGVPDWPWPIRIRTLGGFEILVDDAPAAFARKPPARLLALLKAIIAFGGSDVPEQKLIDALWTDAEGDAAAKSLNAVLPEGRPQRRGAWCVSTPTANAFGSARD